MRENRDEATERLTDLEEGDGTPRRERVHNNDADTSLPLENALSCLNLC